MPLLERWASGLKSTAQVVTSRDALRRTSQNKLGNAAVEGEYLSSAATLQDDRPCGAPGCVSGWIKPWKNRQRPVFEGWRGCSARCIETMVAAAVRRETGDRDAAGAEEFPGHRVPLGLVLLAQGWITHPQLQAALGAQRASGQGRIGEWLTRECGLPEDRIARGLGVQWNCPVLNLDGFSPRAMALLMPKRFVAELGMVPVRTAGSSILYVAFQESMNASAALSLEQMCGLRVESGLLPATQFESARERVLAAASVPVRLKTVADVERLTADIANLLEGKQPTAARLVRMQQCYWLRLWLGQDKPNQDPSAAGEAEMEDHLFTVS